MHFATSGIERLLQNSVIYLDANVFIHAFELSLAADVARSKTLLKFFALAESLAVPRLRTSEFAFGELWVGAYKSDNEKLISFYNRLSVSGNMMEVAAVDISVIRNAAILRSRYPVLKMPDAIHIATAFGFGCTHFLTDDRRLSGVFHTAWNIKGLEVSNATIEIIRPDPETLQRLTNEFAEND